MMPVGDGPQPVQRAKPGGIAAVGLGLGIGFCTDAEVTSEAGNLTVKSKRATSASA
ncbi:hypothetical protein KZZ07_06875 [Mameliella sp. CS4]|uniref:hypothetical protein n=1 Tax=Mameliella sp. CS4 TaxID=2862329 RepID=UPI001C5FE5C6|nr:hypothetical protein [Mameliella sp. CS4]MBW4982265.1 hypothetical protein [Mameliella sp. CS4]